MKKRKLLLAVTGFLLLIGGSFFLYTKLSQNIKPDQLYLKKDNDQEELQKAMDFIIYDQNKNKVKLSDYKNKPIIINFWASWCGPCKSEMATFNNAYNKYGEDIQFMMINSTDGNRETFENALKFISKQRYNFPVYYDLDGDGVMTYGIYALPTTFFIDKNGIIKAQASGAIDEQTLSKGIEMIIN